MKARPIHSKTILSRIKNPPDPYFGTTYSLNLYRGCQHGCIYCDSRSSIYGKTDFDLIEYKENALDLLELELKRKRSKGTVSFGSMNDAYMPLNNSLQLSRKALLLLAKYQWPVHLITKSDLLIKDMDVLLKVMKCYLAVSFSLSTANDSLAKKVEPRAPGPSQRLRALKKLRDNGIYSGLIIAPLLPFIGDTEENLMEILEKGKDAGAAYILFWPGMTQRDGQREYFHRKLDVLFPGAKEKYLNAFGHQYSCLSPKAEKLSKRFSQFCAQNNIPTQMQFFEDKSNKQLKLF